MKCDLRFRWYVPIAVIGLYLLWCTINLFLPGQPPVADAILWRWVLIVSIYLIVFLMPRKAWLLWMLVAVSTAQAFYAIGQQAGYIGSNHSLFFVTGFMGNPGQLGGFQAVAFLTTLMLMFKSRGRKYRSTVLLATALLIAYSLWLSDSRASCVAVFVGIIVMFWSQIRATLSVRKWLYIPLLIIAVTATIFLFNYRSESAKARLLIWRVSMDMVTDKSLTGHGTGSFNQEYMLYQARYFEQHPDSQFQMFADNAAYPYNEFLHVLIEQGVVGLILFLGVFVSAFVTAVDKRMLAPLAGLLVFSLFSYPSYKIGLLLLFPILLGSIESKCPFRLLPKWRHGALTALIVAAAFISVRQFHFYREARMSTEKLMYSYNQPSANFMSDNFGKLFGDLQCNSLYLYWMVSYPEMANESKFDRIMPSCENWCDLGDYFAEKGQYDKAERYYLTASRMIPTRMLPNYRLWKLYCSQNKSSQAARVAEHILQQPLKVENTFTLRVKGEVKRYSDK